MGNQYLKKFLESGVKDNSYKKYIKQSFSQCGEDLIISHIFKRKLDSINYIDIGAYHPWKLNNTALFYLNGSHGINIEPNPELFNIINKHRKQDINLNCGIAPEEGMLDFYILSSPTLSTFSKKEAERYAKHENEKIVNIIQVPVTTITKILSKYFGNNPVDLLSVDVEGFDFEIISSINFKNYSPRVICVETITYSSTRQGKKLNNINDLLLANGYTNYADTNINTIFVLEEFYKSIK